MDEWSGAIRPAGQPFRRPSREGRTTLITLLLISAALTCGLQQPAQPAASPEHGWRRWVELQSGTLSARYRTIVDSDDVRRANQLQYAGQFRGRFKADARGRLTLNANLATGNSITGGWNNAGPGSGRFAGRWYVKQLYAAWTPTAGLDLSYGSLGPARGAATEITTYDNDAWLTGERITVERPAYLFFDDLTATRGYVGDADTPNVFARIERFTGDRNYYQVLAVKTVRAVTASIDYTRLSGVPWLRLAVAADTPAAGVVDAVRLEHYARFGDDDATGFAVYGEKTIHPRVEAGVGFANVDPRYPLVNADRFARGKRFYGTASVRLSRELTAQLFVTRAVDNRIPIPNRDRIDVILAWNVLAGLRRTSWFR